MVSIFVQVAGAAEKAITQEAQFYQGQPVTWMLLALIAVLVGIMYADLKNSINKLWGHGHGVNVECTNHSCKAEVKTTGVLTKES